MNIAQNLENTEPKMTNPTLEEISEVITEFEQYRERLIQERMEIGQKAKLPKAKVMAVLEPELAKIDATLEELRAHQAALTTTN